MRFKHFVIISLKNEVLLFLNSNSSISNILLHNSNIAFFWHNVEVKPNFYFDGLPWIPLKFVMWCKFYSMEW